MQNFREYARRHCTVPKKFIRPVLKYYTGRQWDTSKTLKNSSCKIWTDRLFNPGRPIVCRDLQVISSFFLRNSCFSLHNNFASPELYSIRYFHGTPVSGYPRERKKDDAKKSEQNVDSDKEKKSDKEESSDKENNNPNEKVPFIIHGIIVMMVASMFIMTFALFLQAEEAEDWMSISWNEFEHQLLSHGEVKNVALFPSRNILRVELQDNSVASEKYPFRRVLVVVPDITKIEEKIREIEDRLGIPYSMRVPIHYAKEPRQMSTTMLLIMALLTMLLFANGPKMEIMSQIQKMNPGFAKFTLVEPNTGKGIKFSDVAGLTEAKVEVMEFVEYLKSPDRFRALGAKIPKGALLLGPPGCGKTMLAKAVATESNVPFFSMNGCEFVELFGGVGAARVRNLFKEAKKKAPSIIYIDEIDAFGSARATSAHSGESEGERTLVQLLVEMDGMSTRDDIIVLASTNRNEVLDKALLRPGRLDRHILIGLPTAIERKDIFEKHLSSIKLEYSPSEYSEYLASLTQGFTGADIANVCNEAALHAARLGKKKVRGTDLMYAIERSSRGVSKATNAMTPQEKRIVAYRESGFALISWLLEHTTAVAKISIVPTTAGSLSNTQLLLDSVHTISLNKIEDLTCAYLGGRVAENIVFGYMTNVTVDQLKKATKLVYKQVAQFGMSPAVGLLNFELDRYKERGRKPFSKKLDRIIDAEVRRIIAQAGERAKELLVKHRNLLNTLAEELVKRETLYYDDIERLIGPPPYPKQRPQIPEAFMSEPEPAEESKT